MAKLNVRKKKKRELANYYEDYYDEHDPDYDDYNSEIDEKEEYEEAYKLFCCGDDCSDTDSGEDNSSLDYEHSYYGETDEDQNNDDYEDYSAYGEDYNNYDGEDYDEEVYNSDNGEVYNSDNGEVYNSDNGEVYDSDGEVYDSDNGEVYVDNDEEDYNNNDGELCDDNDAEDYNDDEEVYDVDDEDYYGEDDNSHYDTDSEGSCVSDDNENFDECDDEEEGNVDTYHFQYCLQDSPEPSAEIIKEVILEVMKASNVGPEDIPLEHNPFFPAVLKDSKRYFETKGSALFSCPTKHRRWKSVHSWCYIDLKKQQICFRFKQKCKICDQEAPPQFYIDEVVTMAIFAVKKYLRHSEMEVAESASNGTHDEVRCEMCHYLGRRCC